MNTEQSVIELATQELNQVIEKYSVPKGAISDGYHTFDELYEHRIQLFIALLQVVKHNKSLLAMVSTKQFEEPLVWKSLKHHDDSVFEGRFILGLYTKSGAQISYHLPLNRWEECDFAKTLDKAPEWDGHTSADVLLRLKNFSKL